MNTIIATIAASIVLPLGFTSCTDDTEGFVRKIEATQTELKKQDSVLVSYRSEISSMTYTTPSNDGPLKYSILNTLNAFNLKVSPLITRLELMIEKNKALVEQVKTNTGDAKQVQSEYKSQVDELELMKPEIASVKSDYDKIAAEDGEAFKTDNDTTTVK
jgi:hypothetical protein